MRLLIVTQAVDRNDPVLGFFHRWLEEFARRCDSIVVICLRKGESDLPGNVSVRSLGKETYHARPWPLRILRYIAVFVRYIVQLRRDYDAVFVHMNPEYIVLGGALWRLMGKRVGLWYVHKSVNFALRAAVLFAHIIFTASKESFRLTSGKVRVVGHGIDTDFFTPDPNVPRGDWWLSVGRLSASKRHDLAIRKAVAAGKALRIAGEGEKRAALEALARELDAHVTFLGALSPERLRDEYRRAALLVHTSETGSLDKVVLEALACNIPVRTDDPALRFLADEGPAYVHSHHSLSKLIPRIMESYVRTSGY